MGDLKTNAPASTTSGGKTTSSKSTKSKKGKKAGTKKSKAKATPGNQFEQPVAIQGVQAEQSTHEQRVKGEHPTTNKPRVHDMGVLHQHNSPSRVGFEHLTIGNKSPLAGSVPPSAKMASPKQVKAAQRKRDKAKAKA